MALQNTITFKPVIGYAGQTNYTPGNSMIDSFLAQELGSTGLTNLYYGCGVFKDYTTPDPSSVRSGKTGDTAAAFAWFVALNSYNENAPASNSPINVDDPVGVMRVGEIFAVAHTAMTYGSPVHLIINDADPTNIGKITSAAVSANVIDISAYASLLDSTATADSVVLIAVSLL